MSIMWRTALLVVMVVQAQQAIADTQNVTIEVGGKSIVASAPVGFHEISQLSPEYRKLMEAGVPPINRALGFFFSENDVERIMNGEAPELVRYMSLQTLREAEHSDISGARFSQLMNKFKQQQDTLLESVRDEVDSLLDDFSANFSKERGFALGLEIGEQVSLGVFMQKSDVLGYAVLTKYRLSVEGVQSDTTKSLIQPSLGFWVCRLHQLQGFTSSERSTFGS